jgi:RHS repeat-associated protein
MSRTATNYALTPSNTVTDSFAYDSATGRVASQTTSISGGSSLTTTQSWKYNALGLLAHYYHPRPSGASPFVVSYRYDSGLPVTQYANGIPMVMGVTYQASGAVSSYATGIITGKNVTTTILQDVSLLARPSQIYATAQATGLRPFDTSGYVYDGGGNIKTIGSDTFTYDERSRLKSATYSGFPTQGYSYDRFGNLLSKAGVAFCTGECANNRLPTASGYSYDSRGNLTAKPGETYVYDGLDRQIRHTAAGSSWNYVFDGSNERVAKAPPAGGAWTYTLRDEGNRVAAEYSGATQSRDNVFLGNLAVVSYANSAVGGNGPVWTFYSSDHLGTPRLVTDIAGATVETRKSWPYGEDVGTPGTFQKLRFALMERDTEASRYYDHARSHEFGLGRFLSPDQLIGNAGDPQSWNRYSYVEGNPMKSIDPDGQELRITTSDPVFLMQVAHSLDRIQSISPRLFTLVDALRRSPNVHQITENSYAEAGVTVPSDVDAALSNQPTGSFVYVDPGAGGFDSMLTHELSHAEDFDTGTTNWRSECAGCASGTESKAVRMRNQLPENKAKPQREYVGKKVKNATQEPANPRKRSADSKAGCTEKKNCNAPTLH